MRRDSPTLKQIESFLAVVDAGSFRRAAEQTGLSQPTLTAQVAALESLLGSRLFERSRAGATLSPVGRQLVQNGRRISEEVRAFVETANESRLGPGGTYKLGVTPTLGPYLLPHLLPSLHERYSALKLYVREAVPRDLERGLIEREFDLILTALPLGSQQLSVTPLLREAVKLVVPADHKLAQGNRVRPRDLHGAAVLVIEEHHLFYRQVEELCQRFGALVQRDYEGTSLDTLRQMVVMGMGIAFLPELYVRSEIRDDPKLHVTEIEGESVFRIHALAWRRGTPARSRFVEIARDMQEILQARFPEMAVRDRRE